MRIDDDELRELFKVSSEEHIQTIDHGLLQLEKHPDDSETLAAILREAHSLKGDSGMLGLTDLGSLAHQIEHILGSVNRGEQRFTPELCDRLMHGMNAIRSLVQEAVTGQPAGIHSFYVLAELMGSAAASAEAPATPERDRPSTPETATHEAPVEFTTIESLVSEAIESALPDEPLTVAPYSPEGSGVAAELAGEIVTIPSAVSPQALAAHVNQATTEPANRAGATTESSYRIETVRVPTHNLDHLMTQAGELTVTKIRVAHRLAEIESVANLFEEWNRDLFLNRFLFDETRQSQGTSHQLQNFYNRTETHLEQLGTLVNRLRSTLYEDVTRLELISDNLEEGIRTLRLLPLSTLFNLFPRMVRDLARQEGKQVELIIEGEETRADKRILEEMKDPLMHIIRNAIDHGIESPEERERLGKPKTAKLHLRSYQTATNIVLEISDDGRGLNLKAIQDTALRRGLCRAEELETMSPGQIQALILSPGFSTRTMVTEISGRGVGLDVLRTNVERLKGNIEINSTPGLGCTIRIHLGTTLATAHVLIVAVDGTNYAIPVESVQMARLVRPEDIFTIEGRDTIAHENEPVSVAWLSDLLEITSTKASPHSQTHASAHACIILKAGQERLGVFVDRLIDEQDVVLKPQSQLLKRVRNVSGATILGTGEVCIVLNPADLVQSVRKKAKSSATRPTALTPSKQQLVLLVEDSIATRTQEKRILEAAGYEVVTAVDGMDGFSKLQSRPFDAVISDVQMPKLDGLQLTARIRQHREYNEIPVILITTLASDDDRRRGAEAGANAYITKSSFNQEMLLETLQRLI